jgi:tetratricopeptide (TPR) repeat protein
LLRPWLAALALVVCGVVWMIAFAWSVSFRPPEIVRGLAQAASSVRLEAVAMGLHRSAAEMRREEVRRLRNSSRAAARLQALRFELADDLRDAAALAEAEGETELARQWMADAVQAAPERVDLLCRLSEMRSRDLPADERRMAALRLVYRYDAPCALVLAGKSFMSAGEHEAAEAYLLRAIERSPQWDEPHLLLARLHARAGDREEATLRAQQAFEVSDDLGTALAAAALVRNNGGVAPARWWLIAQHAWQQYRYVGLLVLVFAVMLLSPLLLALARRGWERVSAQRGTAESAS